MMAAAFASVWAPVVGRSAAPWRQTVTRAVGAAAGSSFVAARPQVGAAAAAAALRRSAMGVVPAGLASPIVGVARGMTMAVVTTEAEVRPGVPKRLKGVHKPVAVTGALKDFAGVSISTRPELIRAISVYVKECGLQMEEDKRLFRTDDKLRKILSVDECAFLSISKHLTPHLKKPEEVSDSLAQEAAEMVAAANAAVDEAEAASDLGGDDGTKSKKRRTKKNSNKALGPARAKAEGRGIFRPLKLSKVLSKVCGAETLCRPDAVKAMWRYIKLNNLQSPDDGRVIVCDPLLKELFECDTTDAFVMNRLLSPHLSKV